MKYVQDNESLFPLNLRQTLSAACLSAFRSLTDALNAKVQPRSERVQQSSGPSFLLLTIGLVLCSSFPAAAQVLYGTLTGNITDVSGASIPNASVKALSITTGVVRETKSNADGSYSLNDINPGTYQITIVAEGFTPQQQNNITVLTNTVDRVNVQLAVGSVTQQVTVGTAPPPLQADRAETDYNISPEQISELPTTSTTGRNFQSLYRLVPGSTPPAEQNSAASNPQRSQAVNVNGVSNSTNTTRIDGAVDAYPWIPYLAAYLPPTDGIESINVVTGSFNAEQGSAGGSAINVTIKSGTNKLHGSAWEYNSIAQFNAQSWQNRTGIRQKNIYNETGGSIGGPILKDKLFFFGDYDRVTVDKAINGTLSVPTAAMRTGDFSLFATPAMVAAKTASLIYDPGTGTAAGANKTQFSGNIVPNARIAPAARILLQNLPLPNFGPAGATVNNFFGSAVNAFNRQSADIKVTYVPTSKTSFFGRYSLSPSTISDPQEFGINPGGGTYDGGQPGAATGLIQNVGLGATHAFTPHFLIDTNGGYTRQRLVATAADLSLGDYGVNQLGIPGTNNNGQYLYGGIPGFYLSTYANLGNANTGSPFTFRDNQYTGNANATYVKGTHSIRFGGEYIHGAINHVQPGNSPYSTPRGGFFFSGGVSTGSGASTTNVNSFADFLLGQASTYQKGVQTFNPETLRLSTFAFFAQDTWQASKALVLNYGIRYEYYPLPVADHFGTARYDPSVRSTVTDSFGTHTVGTVLVGGEGGQDQHAGTANGYGQFVPRFGISYQANQKTVIRSGFGITVDPDNLRNLAASYPNVVTVSATGANSLVAASSLNPGLLTNATQVGIAPIVLPSISSGALALPANVSTFTIAQTFRRGYIESYNLAVQRELPFNLVSTMTYVGTHAIRQISNVDINAAAPGGGNAGRSLNTTYGANTNNVEVYSQMPYGESVYNGLQTQLTRTSNKHGSTGIIYTYSKAMDVSDNSISNGLIFSYPTFSSRNYALAGYDREHNFQWWTSYPFPFGRDGLFLQHGVAGYLLGNWHVSTILSRVSGTPFTVTSSATSLNAPGNTQVADQNLGVSTVVGGRTAVSGNGGNYQYLNPAAFAPVTAVRFGTAGRNSVRGPGLFDLDVSVKREFPIYEQIRLDLSADAFDITNTPAFANPAAVISSAGFGQVTTSNANRSMRLSGRISF